MDNEELQKFYKEKELKTEDDVKSRGDHVALRDTSGFIINLVKGIGNIFSYVTQMEKDGINEHFIISQVEGKTRNGKKLKIQSAIRTRIGLNNFINRDVKSRSIEPRGGHATLRGDHVALRDKFR